MNIFLVTAPGLDPLLADEARALGLKVTGTRPGGVEIVGNWNDVARANMFLRGATRVLARVGEFRAMHLAQLDKRARKLSWADWLPKGSAVRVEATCRKSRIYHNKAAAQRLERALVEEMSCAISPDAPVTLKLRIEDDLCTVSLDTSGEALHKRGLKQQVNKAPMRETLAASFLRACGFDGREPVYDPMCGSGTFPIEAAEIATGLAPGRARRFAWQDLAITPQIDPPVQLATPVGPARFFGSDRDAGAIRMSLANAERAGVTEITDFFHAPISDITPPIDETGLIIVNPPYGGRVGNKKPLYGLYAALGARLKSEFSGWRVGLITSDAALAKTTALPFSAPGPFVDHGGIKIRLWRTPALS